VRAWRWGYDAFYVLVFECMACFTYSRESWSLENALNSYTWLGRSLLKICRARKYNHAMRRVGKPQLSKRGTMQVTKTIPFERIDNLMEIMHVTLFHSQLSLTEPRLLRHISSKHIRQNSFHNNMNTKTPLQHANSYSRKRRGSHVHTMTSEEALTDEEVTWTLTWTRCMMQMPVAGPKRQYLLQ
jgi:hypothetical protein